MPVSPCPVAIVGVSALFPGSLDAGGFWRDILAGRDLLTDVPPSHWLIDDYYDPNPATPDRTYGRRGGFLPDVPFNPVEFGIPPSILPATDTAQLLALIVAKQVLEDAAQGDFAGLNRERISVILGVTSAQELMLHMASRMQRPIIEKSLRDEGLPEDVVQAVCARVGEHYVPWQESTFPGLLGNVVAGRIANRFDLGGTNCVTDAACASSISAMSMALNELHLGQSDMVICGGVDTMNDVSMYMCFSKTPALSPTGDCRPFAADSDGTMLGEGLGMVALKRLADAERDGDRIYAVVRGLGAGSDGRALSVYAPRAEGQMLALDRAYEAAGYGPDTVELVEAHGTGTKAGDVAEFEALAAVFNRTGRADRQWCALGSVKSQVGHTKAAAGAAGLIKTVLALHHKVLPPTIKVAQPNPKLDIEQTPFYLNTHARPWIRDDAHPRRAAVSSFGFGGSNFHTTLEEYLGPGPRAHRVRAVPSELVVLSAGDAKGLVDECHEWRQRLKDGTPLAFVAHRTQMAFDASKPARLAIVATDLADLRAKLDQAADAITRDPVAPQSMATGLYFQAGADAGDLAFLFPGQGSQYVSMGADLALTFDASRATWDRAAAAIEGGTPLHAVVFPLPAFTDDDRRAQSARLTATEWAQPAIGVTSLAQLALLRELGVSPKAVGGHSYGEVTALHAAGALGDADMVRVARRRGELMAAAAATTSGAMTAVGRPAAEVDALIADWGVPVVVANANSPKQTVLSGATEAIADMEARLAKAGLACTRLPVATAFHSPIVSPACEPFLASLSDVAFGTAAHPGVRQCDRRALRRRRRGRKACACRPDREPRALRRHDRADARRRRAHVHRSRARHRADRPRRAVPGRAALRGRRARPQGAARGHQFVARSRPPGRRRCADAVRGALGRLRPARGRHCAPAVHREDQRQQLRQALPEGRRHACAFGAARQGVATTHEPFPCHTPACRRPRPR
jgi:polyketide-type polyunsaturated fatty acid synthase PfaA